jgi:hypothetical protein
VIALFADVLLLVVAVALGGVERNIRRAAGAFVTLVVLGNGLDGSRRRSCHAYLRCARRKTTRMARRLFRRE